MKRYFCLFLLFFSSAFIYAGPFGLSMGMNLSEIKKACGGKRPQHIEDDRYFIKPVKSHPLFKGYTVCVNDKVGLYCIRGESEEFYSNDYGLELKEEMSKIIVPLEKKYGPAKIIDTFDTNSIWKGNDNWMRALADGARRYEAVWHFDEVEDGLVYLAVGARTKATYKTNEPYIWIEYKFENHSDGFEDFDDVL